MIPYKNYGCNAQNSAIAGIFPGCVFSLLFEFQNGKKRNIRQNAADDGNAHIHGKQAENGDGLRYKSGGKKLPENV